MIMLNKGLYTQMYQSSKENSGLRQSQNIIAVWAESLVKIISMMDFVDARDVGQTGYLILLELSYHSFYQQN